MNPYLLGKVLVTLQFALVAALAALCLPLSTEQTPSTISYTLWGASVALGLWTLSVNRLGNFNIRPEPKAQGRLVQAGPYRWVRHPMYGSVLLLSAGGSAWVMSLAGTLIWLVLFGVLAIKASLEERWLLQRYPDYAAYRKGTWRLLPGVY